MLIRPTISKNRNTGMPNVGPYYTCFGFYCSVALQSDSFVTSLTLPSRVLIIVSYFVPPNRNMNLPGE